MTSWSCTCRETWPLHIYVQRSGTRSYSWGAVKGSTCTARYFCGEHTPNAPILTTTQNGPQGEQTLWPQDLCCIKSGPEGVLGHLGVVSVVQALGFLTVHISNVYLSTKCCLKNGHAVFGMSY